MKRLKRIFTSTLPLFLLLWAGMMVILGGLTREKLLHEVQSAIESAREKAEYNYQRFGAGEATTPQKAADLSYRLDGRILASVKVGTYDAPCNLYSMLPMARSWPGQFGLRHSHPAGAGRHLGHLAHLAGPVLSPEEQLDFAHLLLEIRCSPLRTVFSMTSPKLPRMPFVKS